MYLIPKPHIWKEDGTRYHLPYTGIISFDASCGENAYEYAKLLQQEIMEDTGFHYRIVPGAAGASIVLAQEKKENLEETGNGEAYRLEITSEGVRICGSSSRGLLWGVQTLRQILRQECGTLPCLLVEDAPDIPNRGFYHDTTRGRIPKLSWLMQLADTLSFYKINQLQLYVEHSYLFEGLSEVWRDDTPLTAQEIMEFDSYCRKRGIELVPSLSSFGHLYKLLRTKQYRRLCELEHPDAAPFSFEDRMQHHTINVSEPDGIALIKKMIREYMKLFTSRKFNICADETFDLGKGKNSQKLKTGGSESCLYIPYVKELCQFLVNEGRTPMIWGDRLIAFPELAKELPAEVICLNWNYEPDVTEDDTRTYAEIGMRQYVCPGVNGWNHLMNPLEDSWKNISRMCSYGAKYHAEGVLNTDWGDYGHVAHPLLGIPGMIYGAAASWNSGQLTYEELNRQISVLEYRDRSGKLLSIVDRLSKLEGFGWRNAVLYKEKPVTIPADSKDVKAAVAKVHGWTAVCCIVTEDGAVHRVFGPDYEADALAGKKYNIQIDGCVRELTDLLSVLDSSRRDRIYPYLLAAEGMKLFNSIGYLLAGEKENKDTAHTEAMLLAEQLESWYYRFRQLWHTVSKESELYRIGEVIFWYADYLREEWGSAV